MEREEEHAGLEETLTGRPVSPEARKPHWPEHPVKLSIAIVLSYLILSFAIAGIEGFLPFLYSLLLPLLLAAVSIAAYEWIGGLQRKQGIEPDDSWKERWTLSAGLGLGCAPFVVFAALFLPADTGGIIGLLFTLNTLHALALFSQLIFVCLLLPVLKNWLNPSAGNIAAVLFFLFLSVVRLFANRIAGTHLDPVGFDKDVICAALLLLALYLSKGRLWPSLMLLLSFGLTLALSLDMLIPAFLHTGSSSGLGLWDLGYIIYDVLYLLTLVGFFIVQWQRKKTLARAS